MSEEHTRYNKNSDSYKIGALLPLTGKDSKYGLWIKEALELGKEDINKKVLS